MAINLPDHYPSLAKDCGAQKWVKKLKEIEVWFRFVDYTGQALQLFPEDGPQNRTLATAIGAKIHSLGLFIPWAVKQGASFESEEKSLDACMAVGWCILQRYYKAVDRGNWTKPW